jgi:membrane-bound ClpP family serine protease
MEEKKMSEKSRFWLGVFLVIVGVVLTFIGFFTPPVGEIHGSVLGAVGEFLALGGALVGADAYVELKVKKIFHNRNKWEDKIETEENDFDEN